MAERDRTRPATPVFDEELEQGLRREVRAGRRPGLRALMTPQGLRLQRLVLHGSMSVLVFVVAASVALPMLRVEPGPAISPRAAWAEAPITAKLIREPSHGPVEVHLIDGRYEVDDFEPVASAAEDDLGRTHLR